MYLDFRIHSVGRITVRITGKPLRPKKVDWPTIVQR
jgi:hypothetical protein